MGSQKPASLGIFLFSTAIPGAPPKLPPKRAKYHQHTTLEIKFQHEFWGVTPKPGQMTRLKRETHSPSSTSFTWQEVRLGRLCKHLPAADKGHHCLSHTC